MTVGNIGTGILSVSDIIPDQEWITSVSPSTFVLQSDSTQSVTIRVNAEGLGSGTYYGTLQIISNDPDESPYNQPVKLIVTEEGMDDNEEDIPSLSLYPNFPNPFSNLTTFKFSLKDPAYVNLSVYNIKGQRIATVVDKGMAPGSYEIPWSLADEDHKLKNGIYFYRLEAGDKTFVKKMVIMRQ
jgi:hypothetical protein